MSHSPTVLRAFHGSSETKTKYLTRVREHRKADQLIQGETWNEEEQKGCAIGCTLHGYSHSAYEEELGIPRALARLEDGIFEGLNVADSREWPERFLEAIQPGADLSMVWPQFAHWLLLDPDRGAIRHAKAEASKNAILKVGALFASWIAGKKPPHDKWVSAYAYAYADAAAAARAAARAAAYAYADAAARAAAYADADAAAYAAAYADADAAAYAYADAAAASRKAREASRKAQADKLVSLMAAAPVPSMEPLCEACDAPTAID